MSAITYRSDFLDATISATSTDDHLRDFLQDVALGLGTSFYWAGSASSQGDSAASTGEMLPGTMMLGKVSALTQAFPDGSLVHWSPYAKTGSESRISWPNRGEFLVHLGSTSSHILGSSMMESWNRQPPDGKRWLVQEGSFEITLDDSSGYTAQTDFPTPYDTTPIVFMAIQDAPIGLAGDPYGTGQSASPFNDGSGFISNFSIFGNFNHGTITVNVAWRSEGTARA